MKNLMTIVIVLLGLFISGCSLMGKPEKVFIHEGIYIKNIIIKNKLNKKISNVQLKLPETNSKIELKRMSIGQKSVTKFNKEYLSQKKLYLKYDTSAEEKSQSIRVPERHIEKNKPVMVYDLEIQILSFGLSIELKPK